MPRRLYHRMSPPKGRVSIAALVLSMCIVAMATSLANLRAADPLPYQPAGARVDVKVPIAWNRFYTHGEISGYLKQLAAAYPKRAKLESLGKSYGDRELWVLTIANFDQDGKPPVQPAFWIDGGIHANELQSVEVVLYTAWYLLEMYDRNPRIQSLCDTRTFYLAPMLSPDSRDMHMQKPNTTHSPRTGQRPFDDDLDGHVDEDGPDDLDRDGHITQMRVRDPHGKFKKHEEFPQFLIPVKPGEKGEYTLLGSEGIDNDGDGEINEDGDGNYDPNRDWGWNWQPKYVQNGAHRYPFSLHENRVFADFIRQHPAIAGAQSYHNTGGMLLRGPGAKDDRYEAADLAVYDRIGKQGEKILPGYRYINIAQDLYEVYGGEIDWLHGMQGAYTFTNELFTPFNFFRKQTSGFFAGPEELHQFNRFLLFGDGFVEWHEVDHPQYGTIEVGGFTKNWQRQPPSFLLEEECHRNMAFTLYHAEQLPQLAVTRVTARPVAGDLVEVTAIIENRGVTPTRSTATIQHQLASPDRVTLSGTGQPVLAFTSSELLFRQPKPQHREPAVVKLDTVPGEGVVYVRWLVAKGLVEGKPARDFVVKIESVKGGVAEGKVE